MELIRVESWWSGPVRAAQVGFGFWGLLLLGLTAFVGLVEIWTDPRRSAWMVAVGLGCLAVELLHVYTLSAGRGRMPVWRWAMFGGAVTMMTVLVCSLMSDPTAKLVLG